MELILKKSNRKNKKWMIDMGQMKHHFGDSRYEDYTKHKDKSRKKSYLARHHKENWSKSGIHTAGFWSRWLLWNELSISDSINDIEKRFDITIKYQS